jgi:hypothetical protein
VHAPLRTHVCRWDWEVAITPEQRTVDHLKDTVQKVYRVIKDAEAMVAKRWPSLQPSLPEDIHFVTAEELHERWPGEGIHGRENAAVRKWGAIFIIGMGWPMPDGSAPEEVCAARMAVCLSWGRTRRPSRVRTEHASGGCSLQAQVLHLGFATARPMPRQICRCARQTTTTGG